MNKTHPLIVAALTAAVLAACATPGPDSVEHAKDVNEAIPLKVSDAASVFLVEMVDARLMDIQQGKLALDRSQQPAIRDYGALMVRDQQGLLDQLDALAARSRVTVPVVVGADKREHLEELMKLDGEKFDKAFIKSMRLDHERDVGKFEKAANLPDPAVAAYASSRLPLIQSHLDSIRAIDRAF